MWSFFFTYQKVKGWTPVCHFHGPFSFQCWLLVWINKNRSVSKDFHHTLCNKQLQIS